MGLQRLKIEKVEWYAGVFLIGLASVLLSCAGCTDQRYRASVREFRNAALQLEPQFKAAVEELRELDTRAKADEFSRAINDSDSQKVAEFRLRNFGPGLSEIAEHIRKRETAVTVVTQYGVLLDSLANSTSADEIRTASQSLTSALLKLDDGFRADLGLSKEVGSLGISRADLLSSVVRFVGNIIIEHKRKKWVAYITDQAEEPLRSLGLALETDASVARRHVDQAYDRAFDTEVREPLMEKHDALQKAKKEKDVEGMQRVQQDIDALRERARALFKEREAVLEKIAESSTACRQVTDLHQAIRSTLRKEDVAEAIREINERYKDAFEQEMDAARKQTEAKGADRGADTDSAGGAGTTPDAPPITPATHE